MNWVMVIVWLFAMLTTAVVGVLSLAFLAERGAPAHGSEAHSRQQTTVDNADGQRVGGGSSEDSAGKLTAAVDHHE